MFGCLPDYVLHNISYANILLYSKSLPVSDYDENEDNAPLYDATKDANNVDNFKDETFDDEEIVRI